MSWTGLLASSHNELHCVGAEIELHPQTLKPTPEKSLENVIQTWISWPDTHYNFCYYHMHMSLA